MKKALTIGSIVLSTVSFAAAQAGGSLGQTAVGAPTASSASGLIGLITTLQTLLDRAVPLIISLAVLGLFWFLLQFVWKGSSDPKAREDSIKGMGYSLIAIFVMVAIWGIIAFIANLTGIGVGGTAAPIIPVLPK
jgi:hypothetical protein